MRFAHYSEGLTKHARQLKRFLDKRSKIGLRPDGSQFVKLGKKDWEIQYQRVVERDHWECQGFRDGHFCLTKLNSETADVDHILPRGKGGDDSLSNLQLLGNYLSACKCHSKKHLRIKHGPEHDVRLMEERRQ
jgi:HNH endonuclease